MATFPTRVLLATDGSPDTALAASTAVELCERTGSELHVAHAGEYLPTFYAFTSGSWPSSGTTPNACSTRR